jgi:hypothetical protein
MTPEAAYKMVTARYAAACAPEMAALEAARADYDAAFKTVQNTGTEDMDAYKAAHRALYRAEKARAAAEEAYNEAYFRARAV